ncbi:MAG TPA: LuxR C-terminal-related transcriptional regulator [Chitinophagales bacterium]|nr:LuxR C-terminal-related transcriptional regulator [Chitinophagales bacterium]
MSKNTVETHRKNMLAKLNVNNTAALLKIAYKKGLV